MENAEKTPPSWLGSPDIRHRRDPLVLDDPRRTLHTQLPLGEMLTP